jgi:5-hydroxyisourate hydrolase
MTLSTHVLDTARGVPAAGVAVTLYALDGSARTLLAQSITDADGRTEIPLAATLTPGTYELVFAAGAYFGATPAFYADIPVRFTLAHDHGERYHVPLLLSPWGYTTYRGS